MGVGDGEVGFDQKGPPRPPHLTNGVEGKKGQYGQNDPLGTLRCRIALGFAPHDDLVIVITADLNHVNIL